MLAGVEAGCFLLRDTDSPDGDPRRATRWVNAPFDQTAGGRLPVSRRKLSPRRQASTAPIVDKPLVSESVAAPFADAPVADTPPVEAPAAAAAAPVEEEAPVEEVAPAEEVPTAAVSAADPNKASFTVLLKNPDGEQTVEYDKSSDEYLLDYIDELDDAEDYEHLPYACRAGGCSACAGKLVSGTMDTQACGFLTPEQKADGWVLTVHAIVTRPPAGPSPYPCEPVAEAATPVSTALPSYRTSRQCTAKPTSDVVIETHKEDDMY